MRSFASLGPPLVSRGTEAPRLPFAPEAPREEARRLLSRGAEALRLPFAPEAPREGARRLLSRGAEALRLPFALKALREGRAAHRAFPLRGASAISGSMRFPCLSSRALRAIILPRKAYFCANGGERL